MHNQPPVATDETEAKGRKGLNRKYLRPQDLQRLLHGDFSARRAVEGLYTGRHTTKQHGQSIEFHDYRQYMPGDAINHVDWKVYGRTDRLFIKLFEHKADLTVHLLIDGSRSMDFRGFASQDISTQTVNTPDSKYDCACRLAAAIGFLIARQRDRFSCGIAQEGLQRFCRPGSTMPYLMEVLDQMEAVHPKAAACLPDAIEKMLPRSGNRDLLCVFSDFLDDPTDLRKQLAIWMQRGGEVIVFQVLHDDEIELPRTLKPGLFIDSESGQQVQIDAQAIAVDYRAQMQRFMKDCSSNFKTLGIDHNLAKVKSPFATALEKYFAQRTDRLSGRLRNF